MVDGLTYQAGGPGAFCLTASHSASRTMSTSDYQAPAASNLLLDLDLLQHKCQDAPKQADTLMHLYTELHPETSRASSGVSKKGAPLPGVTSSASLSPLHLPLLCTRSLPHGDSFSGVYDPTWYEKAAALPDGHDQ